MLYRLKKRFHYARFKYFTRGIDRLTPLPCDPAGTCAVHTMVGREDLPLYLIAIKSLLRFAPQLAVVAHSDGTLDENGAARIRHHIPGVRVVSVEEAEDRAVQILGKDSFIYQCRTGTLEQKISWRRLIDTELWESPRKKMLMDSDVICIRRPEELLNWIEKDTTPFLFGQAPKGAQPSADMSLVQNIFKSKLGPLSQRLGMSEEFLDGTTSGCYGSTDEMSMEKIEQLIKVCQELEIPVGQWGCEQCAVIYFLSNSGGRRLDPSRYINFDPSCEPMLGQVVMAHFYGTHRFYKNLYPQLASRVVQELAA